MNTSALSRRWVSRAGLLALTVIFVEIIGWYQAGTYDGLDWLVVVIVDGALVLMVVDFIVRWHTGNWLTILIASGIFGVGHGAFVSLGLQVDLPLSLVLFGTAMPTLMFLGAYFSFQLLYVGHEAWARWWLVVPLIGLGHGLWVRWLPALDAVQLTPPQLATILPLSVVLLAGVAVIALVLPVPARVEREDWLLTPIEWVMLVLVPLLVTTMLRVQNDELVLFPFLLALLIIAILSALLWFYHQLALRPAFQLVFRPQNVLTIRWLIALVPFAITIWFGYELPGEGSPLQFTMLLGTLIAFGIAWPPLVSVFVSVQAFIELSREEY